jgi:2-amino-4-hydroxy-6-hydroxymethyldihydropteridine diphosphokinase
MGDSAAETVYLSVGSNLGDRRRNLTRAVKAIAGLAGISDIRVSSIYETEPVGYRDQPFFLNIGLVMAVRCKPGELLDRLMEVEADLGRVRGKPGGPRTIDIDILFFGSRVLDEEGLTVPHPRIEERGFVLAPLVELDPELVHPRTGIGLKRMLSEIGVSGPRVTRLEAWPVDYRFEE